MPIAGTKIKRGELAGLFTDDFTELLRMWATSKRWGLPYEGGWASQPCQLMDVLDEFERQFSEWENEKMKR